ncbi:MAG: hypothetical protein RLZZ519_3221 [Bacteroidota bacterium]
MKTLKSRILEAAHDSGVEAQELLPAACSDLLQRITDKFSANSNYRWPLWEHLGPLKCSFRSEETWSLLCEMLQMNHIGPLFLVYESSLEKGIISLTDTGSLKQLLGECQAFVYYVVDPELAFMLSENDHDYLIAMGEAISWVQTYLESPRFQQRKIEIADFHCLPADLGNQN